MIIQCLLVSMIIYVHLSYCQCLEYAEWNFQSYQGDSISLNCNDSEVNLQANEFVEWISPSGEILQSDYNSSGMEVRKGEENGILGYNLLLKNVDEEFRGIFVCYIYTAEGDLRTTALRAVNMAGPLYRRMFDKYVGGLITGVVAALTLCVPVIGSCLVYKYRYKQKLWRNPKNFDIENNEGFGDKLDGAFSNGVRLGENVGSVNRAYVKNEADDIENTTL